MVDAFWTVAFESNFGLSGTGVAVFQNGKVFGGDAAMTYLGNYTTADGQIFAEVKVDKYATAPSTMSVVGLDHFTLKAGGLASERNLVLSGYVAGDPNRKISITASRCAEL